jgi:hypothetical protein
MPVGDFEPLLFQSNDRESITGSTARLANRFRQLARVTAASEVPQQAGAGRFFFPVHSADLACVATLRSYLLRIADELPESVSPVAVLQHATQWGETTTRQLSDLLSETDTALALESTVSDSTRLLECLITRPSYVILSANGFQGIAQRRPARKQLKAVISAFKQPGCRLVASDMSGADDANLLSRLGFSLAVRPAGATARGTCAAQDTPPHASADDRSESVQSALEEIAKVTARIRASWESDTNSCDR